MGSPSDTIRHVLLCLPGFFCLFVLIAWFLFFCNDVIPHLKPSLPGKAGWQRMMELHPLRESVACCYGVARPFTQAAFSRTISLAALLPRGFELLPGAESSQVAVGSRSRRWADPQLPGRVQPPRPVCRATALSGQGHLGDTWHLSCATTWQAEEGVAILFFPHVASKNLATRVILFRSPSPALDTNNPPFLLSLADIKPQSS